jgi:hypothetical protein
MRRDGALVRNRYNDPVYVRTTRVIEPQHYTLVPVSCPSRGR